MTFPNFLSLIRILLSPVFLYLSFRNANQLALIVFFIAAMTDWADGFFARLMGTTSTLGKLLDPIADKVLLMTAYLGFYFLGKIPFWLMALVLCRDIAIMLLGLLALLRQWSLKLDVHFISKINTLFQMLLIGVLIIFDADNFFAGLLIMITACTTVLSGFSYARHFQRWYTA